MTLPRYRANGWTVCEGNHLVATCHTGPDLGEGEPRELASSIAARIATALNGESIPEPVLSAISRKAGKG